MKRLTYIAIALFCTSTLLAQTTELHGIVTDQSGAIVPGAKVTITGPGGTSQEAIAGNDGAYTAGNVTPGTYTVRATAPDLASEAARIDLKPGIQNLNLQLKIVTATQQVTVEDRAV